MAFRTFYLLLAVVLVVSCGKVPESHYYTLEFSKLAQQDQHIDALLHIQAFDASSILKYDKLAYKASQYEIKYDAYRRWAAAPSTLLSEKAVEYFRTSGLFNQVVSDAPIGVKGYSLFGCVNHFEESLQDGQRVALVSIDFSIYDLAGDRKLTRHKSITKSAPIQEESIEGIMNAMSNAVQSVFDDLAKEFISMQ